MHVWDSRRYRLAALELISFQDGCYRNCPAKTYSVEEQMTCVPCDDNCVSCDEHECYWCETDLFLLGEADAFKTSSKNTEIISDQRVFIIIYKVLHM